MVATVALAIGLLRLVLAQPTFAQAEEPAAPLPVEAASWSAWIDELDDPQFARREEAQRRLLERAADPATGRRLAATLWQRMSGEASLEHRARMAEILSACPRPETDEPAPAGAAAAAELALLLDGRSPEAAAEAAVARIVRSADDAETSDVAELRVRRLLDFDPLVEPLKRAAARALAESPLPSAAQRRLVALFERAQRRNLDLEPQWRPAPRVDRTQIDAWLDRYLAPQADDGEDVADAPLARRVAARPSRPSPGELAEQRAREAAERGLWDLLLYDELVPLLREALAQRLADGIDDPGGRERAERLQEWALPTLIAESWNRGDLTTLQFLNIGVPQHPAGAFRVTLFDHMDERQARCVSGNSLLPGDYALRQAIPHPEVLGVYFQLLPCPFPRQRLSYHRTFEEQDAAQRLRRFTSDTIRSWTADGRRPRDLEIVLLFDYMDTQTAAAEIGDYLAAVDDGPGDRFSFFGLPQGATVHHRIAFKLLREGTPAVVPALVRAIDAGRTSRPAADQNPYHFAWMAALAIAAREPWEGSDAWLAGLIERDDRLFEPFDPNQETPTVGATAAALLAARKGIEPLDWGLVRIDLDPLNNAGCPGHVFATDAARTALIDWLRPRQ